METKKINFYSVESDIIEIFDDENLEFAEDDLWGIVESDFKFYENEPQYKIYEDGVSRIYEIRNRYFLINFSRGIGRADALMYIEQPVEVEMKIIRKFEFKEG